MKKKQTEFSYSEVKYKGKSEDLINFVEDITNALKLSIFQKVNIGKLKYNSRSPLYGLESLIHKFLDSKSEEKLNEFRKKFSDKDFLQNELLEYNNHTELANSNTSVFAKSGIMKGFTKHNPSTIVEQILELLNIEKLELLANMALIDSTNTATKPAFTPGLSLKLNLHEITCIEETSEPGKDEIHVAGSAIDDNHGTSIIPAFKTGKYSKGDKKSFPPQILKQFPLDDKHPSKFSALISIAEIDFGGFEKFISKLHEKIKEFVGKIIEKLSVAAGAFLGAKIGGSFGGAVAGPLGLIIGAIAGLIIGALIDWLFGLCGDDVFEPLFMVIELPEVSIFNDPIFFLTYKNFGGEYNVNFSWSVS